METTQSQQETQQDKQQRFIIDTLIPKQCVHLIAGSSGVGKSTLLLQMMEAIAAGESFLDRQTFKPDRILYVSTDRTGDSLKLTLDRVGLPQVLTDIKYHSILSRQNLNLEYLHSQVVGHYQKGHTLVFIEAIARMMQGSLNDYNNVADFLTALALFCRNHNCTIIGSLHATKARERDLIYNVRERLLGSVGWSAFCETIFFLEPADPKDPTNPARQLWVVPRNSQPEQFDFVFNEQGRLDRTADQVADFLFREDLEAVGVGGEFTTETIRQWAENRNLSFKSAQRYISHCIDIVTVERIRKGVYRRVQ